MFTLRRYIDASGSEVLTDWLKSLNDRQARARIDARLLRLQGGNFGDCKPVRDGVSELRMDWGPGYRVYFSSMGKTVVLLLCGGDKGTQDSDIERAIACLRDFKRRAT